MGILRVSDGYALIRGVFHPGSWREGFLSGQLEEGLGGQPNDPQGRGEEKASRDTH